MLNALNSRKITQSLTRKFDTEQVDIAAVYEKYTQNKLRQTGRCLTGLCPFHDERTPSFSIYPDTDSYFCFGCQVSGTGSWLLKQLKDKYGC